MALYPLLDPFWSRFPFPASVGLEVGEMLGVTRIRLARRYLGRELMAVHCYAVGDTLIDSGMPAAAAEVARLARERRLKRAFVTHHHEDHAGGAARLAAQGLDVMAAPTTARLLASDLPLPFYQHLAWGRPRPARLRAVTSETVAIGDLEATIVAAPGHAVDQVVLHVPERGWLFSADAFIHDRVKIFRRDEDFATTITTLERLLELDFDTLFCGHRPLKKGGKSALRRKLEWLRDLEGRVCQLHEEGCGVRAIVRRAGIADRGPTTLLTAGDASPANLVRSILFGPTARPEVLRALS